MTKSSQTRIQSLVDLMVAGRDWTSQADQYTREEIETALQAVALVG
jgi:hypothetical protein